jgi:HAE1 family hydrophobic/amphiphilic exporter-1
VSLPARAIARPVTVFMMTIAAMLFGSISLERLNLTLLPELTYPTLTIRTEYEGAAPAEVEEQVTRRIEQRVGVVSGVRKMHSISAAGRSDVILEFKWGSDMDMTSIEVREKLDLVRLPIELEKPSLLRLNPNLDPIYRFSVTLEESSEATVEDLQSLRRYADEFLKRKLDAVPGVAATIVAGGYEDEISIFVDQFKLAQLNLTVSAVGQMLQAANVNLSGGSLEDGSQEYLVRTLNQFVTLDDIRNTIVFQRGMELIRLKDVATVVEGQKDRDALMRVNGQQAIEVSLYKEGDANTVDVAANIRQALEQLEGNLGKGMQITPLYDQSGVYRVGHCRGTNCGNTGCRAGDPDIISVFEKNQGDSDCRGHRAGIRLGNLCHDAVVRYQFERDEPRGHCIGHWDVDGQRDCGVRKHRQAHRKR